MRGGPLYRLAPHVRRAVLTDLEGYHVAVTLDRNRDGSVLEELAGRILAVAVPHGGGPQSDVVVLELTDRRPGQHRVVALSSANVRAVVPL